jgi:hypothetical protein
VDGKFSASEAHTALEQAYANAVAPFADSRRHTGAVCWSHRETRTVPSPRLHLAAPPSGPTAHRPTREEAFDAFCTLLEFCAGHGAAPTTYDQRPGHLPPDAKSSDAFKRWHRAARRAGVAGVWTRGKLLVATAEAWATRLRPSAVGISPLTGDEDAQLDAALGIRAVRRST